MDFFSSVLIGCVVCCFRMLVIDGAKLGNRVVGRPGVGGCGGGVVVVVVVVVVLVVVVALVVLGVVAGRVGRK